MILAERNVADCVSVLFSEPKIPQLRCVFRCRDQALSFSALQRAENSSMRRPRGCAPQTACFSALQRAENSSIGVVTLLLLNSGRVSVLFSEPKIPQCFRPPARPLSASRFQCSSASRKFLNMPSLFVPSGTETSFSALQRAENSSIDVFIPIFERVPLVFQCSSASRKFLNADC